MQAPTPPPITPGKAMQPGSDAGTNQPTPVVDMATIEAAKENIVPLNSGRSASQLAALSSSSRSGLGVKLDAEHVRFQAQIRAVDEYERTGSWEDGRNGLASEDVAAWAEDPLDASHQYVRFIVANYPAGASAANKLVPVLEETTRKFLGDDRYSNDPRYFRLWAHYAKNMEDPEDCYRFLFAKGIAEKLAALYEEYAKVLEAKHKRKQADQVYNLGINRRATPLDRLKRSYLDFQARMLVAPPVPSPPRAGAADAAASSESRAVLGAAPPGSRSTGARPVAPAASGTGTGVGPKGNGSAFAVFRDDAAGNESAGAQAGWDEYGTVKSRTRENELEKKEWVGETHPVAGKNATAGGIKLEVYRDETAVPAASAHRLDDPSDVFSRSTRAPSEAELLRSNPFRHYTAQDLQLIAKDPLEGLEMLPRASSSKSRSGGAKKSSSSSSDGKERKSRSGAATGSSSSATRTGSSSRSAADGAAPPAGPSKTREGKTSAAASQPTDGSAAAKPKEQVAVNLREIYPSKGEEFSPEEVRARKRREQYLERDVERWNDWEWVGKFDEEVLRTKRTTYRIESETGWPKLWDEAGVPLYDFLPRPTPPASPSPPTPVKEEPAQRDSVAVSPSPRSPSAAPAEDAYEPIDRNRPPSPTINTREANALADLLFAKTLDFTKVNSRPAAGGDGDSSDDSDDSDEDGENEAPYAAFAVGGESQYSTQGGTQQSDVTDAPFVPFSQTRSEMDDDSAFFGSQRPPASGASSLSGFQHDLLGALEDENGYPAAADENGALSTSAPMQLFRDPAVSAAPVPATPNGGGFRPVKRTGSARAPLGAKSAPPSGAPPAGPSMGVFCDAPIEEESRGGASSQDGQSQSLLHSSCGEEADFEAPLRDGQPNAEGPLIDVDDAHLSNDGYDLGRRGPGQPSRYAPYVAQMTPIVERTLEFTSGTNLSASTRSRRESYYPTGAAKQTLQEEDEDEEPSTEEDDDEDDADRAFGGMIPQPSFVQQQQQQQQQPYNAHLADPHGGMQAGHNDASSDSDGSSDSSGSGSDSDSDSEEDDIRSAPQFPPLPQPAGIGPAHAEAGLPFDSCVRSNGAPSDPTWPSAAEPAQDSRFDVAAPSPVNPYSDATLARLVESSRVFEHPEVRDLTRQTSARFDVLQREAKRREKPKGGKDRTGTFDEAWDLELNGELFSVREKLGEGSFGAVFRCALAPKLEDDDEDFDEDAEDELSLAVKVEKPTNLWEFHVLTQLHARLPDRLRDSIVSPHRLYAFADESFLCLAYCDQGSLLDAVNRAAESGVSASANGAAARGLDELLAMFFVVELLRVVEGLHSSGFIHGDLKIDNCLLRLEDVPGGARAWSPAYDPSGAGGWSCKGVKVIDFGRTIDTRTFAPGQTFKSHLEIGPFDCAEVKEGRPWTYEPDYHGVASIAFNLLFGKNIETKQVPVDETRPEGAQKWTLKHSWRRYYQTELWTKVFDALLSPHTIGALPITEEIGALRREMEEYLWVNGEKNGKSLRGLIRKLEIASMSR